MRDFFIGYAQFMDRFSSLLGQACSPIYFMVIVISVLEVVMRYVFNSPTQWTFEVVMTLTATAWLLCGGYIEQQHKHIAITVIYLFISERAQKRLKFCSLVLGVFALLSLAYAAFEPAVMAIEGLERTGSAFNPPMPTILKTLLVFGAVLGAAQMLASIIHLIHGPIIKDSIMTAVAGEVG